MAAVFVASSRVVWLQLQCPRKILKHDLYSRAFLKRLHSYRQSRHTDGAEWL